jgi:hypothetical protein
MKLIKISPKRQITIPKRYSHLCRTGWLSLIVEDGIFTLRPIEIKESKTQQEILDELIQTANQETRPQA